MPDHPPTSQIRAIKEGPAVWRERGDEGIHAAAVRACTLGGGQAGRTGPACDHDVILTVDCQRRDGFLRTAAEVAADQDARVYHERFSVVVFRSPVPDEAVRQCAETPVHDLAVPVYQLVKRGSRFDEIANLSSNAQLTRGLNLRLPVVAEPDAADTCSGATTYSASSPPPSER